MSSKQLNKVSKAEAFRNLLESDNLEFLLEAHNGITAKIAQEAGFKALWAGGLCMSAQFGVRDSNEASWTQVLDMLEFMSDAVDIPILLDGDTGYGNFNNVRRLVKKLEQRDIAAVCIEDKLFPKTNSFIDGKRQQLADIDEFCSRIQAGKEAQSDDNFCLITRVEAFIAGWGLDEAIKRASAYHEAGADAILIHSALNNASEVLAFKKEWANRSPVVIVPTKYYATPTDVFREAGFSLAIWANHMLRCSIPAMQELAKTLHDEESLWSVEDHIAPVSEIFRLQGAKELQEAELMYLPRVEDKTRVVILAASRGQELGELTADIPKAMVPIRDRPLIQHIVNAYFHAGLRDVTVVRGYKADAFNLPGLNFADNEDYENTGELASLACAILENPEEDTELFVSYGDVLFKRYILDLLLDVKARIAIVVDADWQESVNLNRVADYVSCSAPHSRHSFFHEVYLKAAAEDMLPGDIDGEWMGFLKVAAEARPVLQETLAGMMADSAHRRSKLYELLVKLMAAGEQIRVVYTTGHWLDVDSIDDLAAAGSFV